LQHSNNKIDAALLSKIVLARFLEMPLRGFDRFVARVESSAEFSALTPWVTVTRVEGAHVVEGAVDLLPHAASSLLGEVREMRGRLMLVYCREHFAREYLFDEAGLHRLRSREDFPKELAGTLHRLRLINNRTQPTHALVPALLESQAEYLLSGEPLSLLSLTQAQMSKRLRAQPGLSIVADAGRISRLVRGLSIGLPNGKTIPLADLLPKPRQIHCRFVDYVITNEKVRISEEVLEGPLSDEAIAQVLEREYGVCLSRRTVANIRHALAIPDCRRRCQRTNYLTATEGFSALVPLTPQALRNVVPAHPGVYEIRSDSLSCSGGENNSSARRILPPEAHGVVYIGSAGDLRKRLGDHLRGSSGNALLYRYVTEGDARVRFRLISEGWRWVERQLYRVYYETFGAPPVANRMSP
jgi:RNA polymerase sigma-54 factor